MNRPLVMFLSVLWNVKPNLSWWIYSAVLIVQHWEIVSRLISKSYNSYLLWILLLGSFPLSINRLDYSEYQHTLRINVTDSRGMTDTFELQFNGVMAGNLPGKQNLSLSLSLYGQMSLLKQSSFLLS